MARIAATLILGACIFTGCGGTTRTASLARTVAPPPTTEASAVPAAPASAPALELVGTWTRTQDCESMLAAFEEGGLVESQAEWIIGNWVGDPEEVEAD